MDKINEEYMLQCEEFLAEMEVTEDEYRSFLKEAHQLMRQEAEMEGDRQDWIG